MTKKFLTLGILIVVLIGTFIPTIAQGDPTDTPVNVNLDDSGENLRDPTPEEVAPYNLNVSTPDPIGNPDKGGGSYCVNIGFDPFKAFMCTIEIQIKTLGLALMSISGLILNLVGKLFDGIIVFSILEMAENLSNVNGVGGAITTTWATLRDIANICFIFVLLWAAFKNMFNTNFTNFGKTVKDIIIVALLINFSLFFSKVVIDASNIVSVGFYKSITTANTYSLGVGEVAGSATEMSGISGGYMRLLGLQHWYSPSIITDTTMDIRAILTVATLSSVFMLVFAVILLVSGVLFLTRFIVLIFLMILSPLALISYIIPGMKKYFEDWKSALIAQSFFAPLFFALTWVTFKIASAPGFLGTLGAGATGANADYTKLVTESSPTTTALILNYVLVCGFAIAALVFSKMIATKTAGFSQISGGIGTVAFGGAAWAGRTTVGRTGRYISESAGLQKAAKEKTGFAGAGARLALYASQKARSATFDARNATIPTSVIGDAIQGTLGRTGVGKKLGLDDVNIPSVTVGPRLAGDLVGKAGTKGYKETKEESLKRVHDREAAAAGELSIAQAKKAVIAGASAPLGSSAIGEMEKALSKLSDKETEALVTSNGELLKSQNFANAISVKQLEALNKSDQFSDTEKGTLKGARFKVINDAMATGGAGATSIHTDIRNLSDSELEMINAEHLEDVDFVSHLKSSQFESINKSNRFTTNQRDKLKAARRKPLADAIVRRNVGDIKKALKTLSPKEISSLDMAILKIPPMLEAYSPSLLKRMVPEMNPPDVVELHDEIVSAAGIPGASANVIKLNTWLGTPDGAIFS